MVIAAIAGYLIGSIPSALIVGRYLGVDPRTRGDRNPGWWNMRALVGERAAAIVLVADVLKGVAAAAVGLALWGPWWTAYVAVAFAMLGHAFPLFADLRGGRSILTFVGGMVVLAPAPAVLAIAIGATFAYAFRHFAYGARVAMFVFPVAMAFYEPRSHVATVGLLMTFIGARFLLAGSFAPSTGARVAVPSR